MVSPRARVDFGFFFSLRGLDSVYFFSFFPFFFKRDIKI